MKRARRWCVVGVVGAIANGAVCSAAGQTILRVKADAPAGGDGLSWGTAYNTLGAALGAAVAGDEVWVAEGTYAATSGIYAFEMKSNVGVFGGFIGTEFFRDQRDPVSHRTTLSGSHARTVVVFVNVVSAVLDGFRVEAGLGHGGIGTIPNTAANICPGGGLLFWNSNATVSGCDVSANMGGPYYAGAGSWPVSAGDGGAAIAQGSTVRFTHCKFSDNRVGHSSFSGCQAGTPIIDGGAGSGGAIAAQNTQLVVEDCAFEFNAASSGIGSVSCSHATSNGEPGGSGGAIYALGGSVEINRSRFFGNRAGGGGPSCESPGTPGTGGAIYASGPLAVRNSLFVSNATQTNGTACGSNAGGKGSAISCANTAAVQNCAFYANVSPGNPASGLGAIYFVGQEPEVRHCIFWHNVVDAGMTEGAQLGALSTGALHRCIVENLSAPFRNNLNVDPLFVDPAGPDGVLGTSDDRFDLSIGSPGIDAGDNVRYDVGPLGNLDLAGNPRLFDVPTVPDTGVGTAPIIDIGPYEFSRCPVDLDNGTGTGTADNAVTIDDLLYFLAAFESGGAAADLDNGTGTGVHDHSVTIDDLLFFLVHFEAGC